MNRIDFVERKRGQVVIDKTLVKSLQNQRGWAETTIKIHSYTFFRLSHNLLLLHHRYGLELEVPKRVDGLPVIDQHDPMPILIDELAIMCGCPIWHGDFTKQR